MLRRNLLKTAAATLTTCLAPRIGSAERAKTLVFVPTSDLTVLDPIITFNRPTRNYAYLVFDTLYGLDTSWMAQPQMVEGHQIEKDGLIWDLKLRDGLYFHDNEPVLGRDVVASIRRFAARISFPAALMAATEELSSPDDRTVRFRLRRPFPHLPDALAGPGGTVPAIMPEHLASESPYKPVREIIGSGPYRFLRNEHVSGVRAAFERFAQYRPRDGGARGFTSGPKIAHFDRVEWVTLDSSTASAALQNGEIDWWEVPPRDLVDSIGRHPDIATISHFATAMGILRFNQLYPPFDNPAIRRALLGAIDQAEAMTTIGGTDPENWHDGIGLFGAGTPLATDVGVEVLRTLRDYPAVKRNLTEAGYNGEKIVVISPADVPELGQLSKIGTEQLRRAGMNIDFQEMDFGTVVRRRGNQAPPDKGGWNAFFTLIDRSIPNTNPYGNQAIRADGRAGWDGWPSSSRIEALRAAWLDAVGQEEQHRICGELQKQLWIDLPFVPMGEYWQATAHRKDLNGVLPGCFATFYGVRRA